MADMMILRNTKMSIVEEVTEGAAVAESANGAFYFTADELGINIDKETIEDGSITGSMTKLAPFSGRYNEDLGFTVKLQMRGKGTLAAPEWGLFMKSIMGQQNANTDNAVKATPTPTTTVITANVPNDFDEGQLLKINDEVIRLDDISAEVLTMSPPLSTTPTALDDIFAGISWMLSSSAWPTFTAYVYFTSKTGRTRRCRYVGCRATSMTLTMEVGQIIQMTYTVVAQDVLLDNTAQAVTPAYDSTTKLLICKGIEGKALFSAVASGVPTQVQTILVAPNFRARIGDYIVIDVGSSVYETALILSVSGDEGEAQTIGHASVSVAASATDTVYIIHTACGYVTGTLEIAIEMEESPDDCMFASSGYSGRTFTARSVNITRQPYFEDWGEFLMRDEVIGSLLEVVAGDSENNIFCAYVPNQITGEVSLTTDEKMMVDVTSMGVKDTVLGNDHEIVFATF
jgi:hypothetical protein